jgi:hypothetical protein
MKDGQIIKITRWAGQHYKRPIYAHFFRRSEGLIEFIHAKPFFLRQWGDGPFILEAHEDTWEVVPDDEVPSYVLVAIAKKALLD